MTKLTDEGLVADDWKSGENKGILTQSVVAIVVRKGNPKDIKGWDDLTKSGVKIVTPNPGSSGSAKWNILAAYGQVIASGGDEADGSGLPEEVPRQRRGPAGQRARTRPRRSRAAPATCCCPTRTRPSRPALPARTSTTSSRTQTLLIENPAALTTDAERRGRGLPGLPAEQGRPDRLRQAGLPPARRQHLGRGRGCQRPGRRVPDADDAADRRRRLRWVGRGQHEVLRRGERHRHEADR